MTVAKSPQFKSFEEYLAVDSSDLPEGHCEYWDGELIPVMSESIDNILIARYLAMMMVAAGIAFDLIYTHACEVEVIGSPRTRYPDLVLLEPAHLARLKKRATITRNMAPPRLIAEVVSPGNEDSDNYKRDYQAKARQYAAISVPEYWIIDPVRSVILVGQLENGQYQFTSFGAQQVIVSSTIPSLNLTTQQILSTGK